MSERPEKILVAMFRLSKGVTAPLNYEDIVVEAFNLFPDEFALRGYPQFPDSSDIHKPLYSSLKRRGLVSVANKRFSLTPRGLEFARGLTEVAGNKLEEKRDPNRLSSDIKAEVARLIKTDAFHFFRSNQQSKIIDTDFYAFLDCTVRTDRNAFFGRLKTVDAAVKECIKINQPNAEIAQLLLNTLLFLKSEFADIINRRKKLSS